MLDPMTTDQAVRIASSLLTGRWCASEQAATDELRRLGFTFRPEPARHLTTGSVLHDLTPAPGIDHAGFTTLDGEPAGVVFFIASSMDARNPVTNEAYQSLLAALTQSLGPAERVWPDEDTPIRWRTTDLDVGLQLFDRRDSSVMVSVEHRARSEEAESRARQPTT